MNKACMQALVARVIGSADNKQGNLFCHDSRKWLHRTLSTFSLSLCSMSGQCFLVNSPKPSLSLFLSLSRTSGLARFRGAFPTWEKANSRGPYLFSSAVTKNGSLLFSLSLSGMHHAIICLSLYGFYGKFETPAFYSFSLAAKYTTKHDNDG